MLHGAACHCCSFASETSCEKANRFLDRRFLLENLEGFRFLGFVPYDEKIIEADLRGAYPEDVSEETQKAFEEIARNVVSFSKPDAQRA